MLKFVLHKNMLHSGENVLGHLSIINGKKLFNEFNEHMLRKGKINRVVHRELNRKSN